MKTLVISAHEAHSFRSRHPTGEEAFRALGLDMPNVSMKTLSVHLRANLLATGQFITAFPHSVLNLYARRFALKVLSLELPVRPWPS